MKRGQKYQNRKENEVNRTKNLLRIPRAKNNSSFPKIDKSNLNRANNTMNIPQRNSSTSNYLPNINQNQILNNNSNLDFKSNNSTG